jgi:hypothetical protein
MNVYQRILNILLEARVDMFIQDRLDERSPQARANKAAKNSFVSKIRHQEAPGPGGLSGRESEAADDHAVRLAGAKKKPRTPTNKSEKLAVGRDNLRQGDTYNESSEQAKANKAKQQALKKDSGHRVDKLLKGRFSDGGISANALKLAGEARRSGNKPEAQRQVARSQKTDKRQLP